jgi:hypothetical protein
MGEPVETLRDLLAPWPWGSIPPRRVSPRGTTTRALLVAGSTRVSPAQSFCPQGTREPRTTHCSRTGLASPTSSSAPRPAPLTCDPTSSPTAYRRYAIQLDRYAPRLVIFTFKRTTEVVLGRIRGHGLIPADARWGIDCFVMPGPYERADRVDAAMRALAGVINSRPKERVV